MINCLIFRNVPIFPITEHEDRHCPQEYRLIHIYCIYLTATLLKWCAEQVTDIQE